MIVMIQHKQPRMPISIVVSSTCKHGGCMITIGKIPQKVNPFFKPIHNAVSAHVYTYYCSLVVALCISHGSTIERLVELLRGSPHRTNHGEFLWRSAFDEMAVVQASALAMLKRLYKKGCKDCLLIIDDTQTIKRAKKMQAVGKIHHHATGKYCMGHTILKACLYYRGVTIPLGSWLYIKKEHAKWQAAQARCLRQKSAEANRALVQHSGPAENRPVQTGSTNRHPEQTRPGQSGLLQTPQRPVCYCIGDKRRAFVDEEDCPPVSEAVGH